MIRIEQLTRQAMQESIEAILELERVAIRTSEGRYPHAWTREQFLFDLPGKWDFSRLVYEGDELSGFFIGSRKTLPDGSGCIHGHRIVFSSEVRSVDANILLWRDVFKAARSAGLAWFTGYLMEYNPDLLTWYKHILRVQFPRTREEIEQFTGPLSDEVDILEDGRIDTPSMGKYLIVKKL